MNAPIQLTLNIAHANDLVNQFMMEHLIDFSHRPHEIICAYLNRDYLPALENTELRDLIRHHISPEIYAFTGLYLSHIASARPIGMADVILVTMNPYEQIPHEDQS